MKFLFADGTEDEVYVCPRCKKWLPKKEKENHKCTT